MDVKETEFQEINNFLVLQCVTSTVKCEKIEKCLRYMKLKCHKCVCVHDEVHTRAYVYIAVGWQ